MTEGLSVLRTWLTGVIVVGLLAVAALECVTSAWSADPTAPAVVLQSTDRALSADRERAGVNVKLCPLQRGLKVDKGMLLVRDEADGLWRCERVNNAGIGYVRFPTDGRAGRRDLLIRLAETAGLGRAEQRVSIYLLTPPVRAAVIDLESIKRAGRYEFSQADRAWLGEQAAGCKPILYVADVEPVDYAPLREQLAASGWPAGPLWMWRRNESYKPRERRDLIGHLLKRGWLRLAVLADSDDNRILHDLIQGWSNARRDRLDDPVRVVVWPK
jgi:hypothetical protein